MLGYSTAFYRLAGSRRYATTAFGFVLCFGPYLCFHNLQLACTHVHKFHKIGHAVFGAMVGFGLCYLCGGLALLIADIDIVSSLSLLLSRLI